METSNRKHLRLLFAVLLALLGISVSAQTTVNGTVTDSTGEPIIGASVVEKGKTGGVVTDYDGNYSIRVADANSTLTFSYILKFAA